MNNNEFATVDAAGQTICNGSLRIPDCCSKTHVYLMFGKINYLALLVLLGFLPKEAHNHGEL